MTGTGSLSPSLGPVTETPAELSLSDDINRQPCHEQPNMTFCKKPTEFVKIQGGKFKKTTSLHTYAGINRPLCGKRDPAACKSFLPSSG